jgi:hypothetical protein
MRYRRAAVYTGRVISIGQFILFSTKTGDALLLDPSDQLAARLARDGTPNRSTSDRLEGHYRIEGAAFVNVDRDTGRTTTSSDIRRIN